MDIAKRRDKGTMYGGDLNWGYIKVGEKWKGDCHLEIGSGISE